jgi:hypothetical protein
VLRPQAKAKAVRISLGLRPLASTLLVPLPQATARAVSLCAQHVRSLGSESLLSNLMEVKD